MLKDISNGILKYITEAGKIIAKPLANENDSIYSKAGTANFVTEYDLKIQSFLITKLSLLLPEAHFLSEEDTQNNYHYANNGYTFVIDPLDGTTNFIHGYRHSSVSVGLLHDGEPIYGAVYNPYTDEIFYAEKSFGAFHNGSRIHVSDRSLENSLISFGSSPYYRELADDTFNLLKKLFLASRDIRRSGSAALDLCYVADGRCDLFFEKILSPWDYAAGALILKEAGGVISTMEFGPITFDKQCSIIAANPVAYEDYKKL
jgi:myo-inositol-1(or 4)-monophosphatase